MVNRDVEAISRVFQALSDPTRRRLLQAIARSDPTVGELGAPFDMSAPAISKHLKVLESAGLITRLKRGKTHRFRLQTQPLTRVQEVVQELAAHWTHRLDKLEELLDSKGKST